MWMWNYITGADPDEGQEVSPEKPEEGSGGEGGEGGGLEEVEIDGLIYLADYENGDIFAYDVQDAKLAGWINEHGEAEFFPADETDRHPTLVMIEETLRNLIWAETDEEGKPKSIEPEWVKLFSDLYWAAQADLRKPLPENIEEVLVPVEDSEDEESGDESGDESGGEGPEEGGDGAGGGDGADGGDGGGDAAGKKGAGALKEGDPGWDVEKLRFTEDEELVEEGGVPATPDGADAGKGGFGEDDAANPAAAAAAPPAPPAAGEGGGAADAGGGAGGGGEGGGGEGGEMGDEEEDEEDLELMYFDKEKDVVMPMHPVHYQYVKLLEELLAEAGFEYQDEGSSSGGETGSSYTGSGSEYTGSGSGSEEEGESGEESGSGDEELAEGDEAEEGGRAEEAAAAPKKDTGVGVDVGGGQPAAAAAAPPAPPAAK